MEISAIESVEIIPRTRNILKWLTKLKLSRINWLLNKSKLKQKKML